MSENEVRAAEQAPEVPASAAAEAEEKVLTASQWQPMWWKFRRHKMAMFGGAMMPLAFMPSWMRNISHFSPIKWAILAMEGAIWRDFRFTEMLVPCAVLIAVGAVFFTLGVFMLRKTRL